MEINNANSDTYSFNYKWFIKMNESMILVFLLIEKIFFSNLFVIL